MDAKPTDPQYIICHFGTFHEAVNRARNGDTLSVHPPVQGPPGLYEVRIDDAGEIHLDHVDGTPPVLLRVDSPVYPEP